MILQHKDYVEKEPVEKPAVKDIKDAIKAFVGVGKKTDEEIVNHIQKTHNMTNDEIITQIKEIRETDKDYQPVVVEEIPLSK